MRFSRVNISDIVLAITLSVAWLFCLAVKLTTLRVATTKMVVATTLRVVT